CRRKMRGGLLGRGPGGGQEFTGAPVYPPTVVPADLSVDRRPDHRVNELNRVLATQKTGTHEDAGGPSRRLPIQAGQLGNEFAARLVSQNCRRLDEADRL